MKNLKLKNHSERKASIQAQKGAVSAEFLVVASTVLVSMFLLIPILAKYSDLKHKTEQAAQYASWERTVWNNGSAKKSQQELENEAHQRILADSNTPIFSQQNKKEENLKNIDTFHYFMDSNQSPSTYSSLFTSNNQQLLTLKEEDTDQPGLASVRGAFGAVGTLLFKDIDLAVNMGGYYKSDLSMGVKQPAWLDAFSTETLTMQTKKAILVDGWDAGGNERLKKKVNGLQSPASGGLKLVINGYKKGFLALTSPLRTIGVDIGGEIEKLDFDGAINTEELYDPDQLGTF